MIKSFFLLSSLVSAAGIFVTGCASSQTQTKPQILPANGLTAQTLADGECGLFLWAIENPRNFVFFQNNNQNTALFYSDKTEKTVLAVREHPQWNDVLDIDISYTLSGVKSLRVKGIFSDDVESGRRINQAAITITKQDGWQELIPVSGVYACSN